MKQYNKPELIIVGGGLAGSEAAWQAASMGINVHLYEMRPQVNTGAHQSNYLAELVCSNSLGSDLPDRAAGILKRELRTLGSLLMHCADETAVPAGGALAVDRELFAQKVTGLVENHPLIKVTREEVVNIPDGPAIIASGPLTSAKLSSAIQNLTGREQIFFYDAIAPVVYVDSIDMDIVFRASRYGKNTLEDGGDYFNCPMKKDEYYSFVEALINAERIPLLVFERELNIGVRAGLHKYFEGCLPIEVIAMRGRDSLAYGPLRPVGLTDPRTGEHSYAVVQLRQDNKAQTLYNIVGFQTNLKYAEQERVIRMIPGLEQVQFSRYGQMHRNTFIFSPGLLKQTLQTKSRDDLFFAGQITGVEGYVGNIATGLLAGRNAANLLLERPVIEMSPWTMIGALTSYITHAEARDFQPMKANLGILPDLGESFRGRRIKAAEYAKRSESEIQQYIPQKFPDSFA
jgi:methylenetetrahydrofolate--tRNA-(uracil-5-)-methyltransferase